MFVHEQPLNEHRTVKEVFNSYKARHRTSCTLCKQVEPLVHLKVDVEQSESFIIDDGKLNTSLSAIASKFSRDHEGRNEMVFIVSVFLEERSIPTNPLCFHLEFHVLLHVFDPSGENYQLKKKILRFNQDQELNETCDHKAGLLLNYCVNRTISNSLDSGFQGKFCLPALRIIPIRNEFSYRPTNSSNFVLELSEVPLYQFIGVLKGQAICDKNVIIILNVVVVRNP